MEDPFGVATANAGEASGVIFSELSAERIREVRARVPSLLNRRFTVVPLAR
jgi:predicted amidohydrolase